MHYHVADLELDVLGLVTDCNLGHAGEVDQSQVENWVRGAEERKEKMRYTAVVRKIIDHVVNESEREKEHNTNKAVDELKRGENPLSVFDYTCSNHGGDTQESC